MVGRWSTALRNFISQTGRVGLNVLYEGFQYGADSLWTSLGGKGLKRTANPVTAMQGFLDIFRQFNPKKFSQVKKDVDNASIFSDTKVGTVAGTNPVTINNLLPGVPCTATVLVTSKTLDPVSKTYKSFTKTFKIARK